MKHGAKQIQNRVHVLSIVRSEYGQCGPFATQAWIAINHYSSYIHPLRYKILPIVQPQRYKLLLFPGALYSQLAVWFFLVKYVVVSNTTLLKCNNNTSHLVCSKANPQQLQQNLENGSAILKFKTLFYNMFEHSGSIPRNARVAYLYATTKKVRLPDRHTDRKTPDKVIPMSRYASQATQKWCIRGPFPKTIPVRGSLTIFINFQKKSPRTWCP